MNRTCYDASATESPPIMTSPNRHLLWRHQIDTYSDVTKSTPIMMSPNRHLLWRHQIDTYYDVTKASPTAVWLHFTLTYKQRKYLVRSFYQHLTSHQWLACIYNIVDSLTGKVVTSNIKLSILHKPEQV